MSERQTINDLLMEVAKLRKDNDYLSGELGYWKQQAQRNESVSGECDTESGVTLRDLFGIWKDTSDQLEADSREKLEADIWTVAYEIYRAGGWVDNGSEPNPPTDGIWKLLDRQAAITKREREQHWLEIVGASANCNLELTNKIAELQAKVDALEAECQKDSKNVADWEDSCDTREILEHDCKWMAYAWAPAEYPDDKLEKKLYREIIEKLDRQAAITKREREQHWLEIVGASANCNLELTNKIAELQEKVDELEADATRVEFDVPHYGWHEGDRLDTASWKANYRHMMKQRDELQEQVDALEAELNRTCSLAYDGKWLTCSNCGESLQWFGVRTVYKTDGKQERALGVEGVRYCPFCGARIEDGESE